MAWKRGGGILVFEWMLNVIVIFNQTSM
jgi:hypothetical protein